MKAKFFSFFGMLFIGLYSMEAQNTDKIIFADNYETSGFLILKKTHSDLNHFKVIVNKVQNNGNGNITYLPIHRLELWNVNYWEIPSIYSSNWQETYAIYVEGLDESNAVLDTDFMLVALDPSNEPNPNVEDFFCESYQTAFRIYQAYDNGLITYSVSPGAPDAYMWFPQGYYPGGVYGYSSPLNGPGSLPLYFMGNYISNVPNTGGPNSPIYRGPDGFAISTAYPFVYGIRKTKYPWCGTQSIIGTRSASSISGTIENAMFSINNSTGWTCEPLFCNEMFGMDWSSTSNGETNTINNLWKWAYLQWRLEIKSAPVVDMDGDEDVDFWDSFINLLEFAKEDELVTSSSLSNLTYLNLVEMSLSPNASTISFNSTHFKDAAGNPIPPSFTLNPGIHQITFALENGKILQFYLPIENKLTNDFPLSNYVNLVAFPVPFTGANFNINIESAAKLDIQLEVKDLSGKIYYSNRMLLRDGHNTDHRINLNESPPNGIYVLTAKFSDGSSKTLLISKVG